MDDDPHEYTHPFWLLASRFMCVLVAAVGTIIALPKDFNFLLSIFIIASVVNFMEGLHINIIEKPRVRAWHDAHMEEFHKDERRDGDGS